MDKGLDIDTWRALLAYHAALNGDFRLWLNPDSRSDSRTEDNNASGKAALALLERLRESAVSPRWDAAERALKWAAGPRHTLLSLYDNDYPVLLRNIAHPPVVLFLAGDPALLQRPQIAIVGSRQATPPGVEFAGRLAAELSVHGVVTVSGLAYGIDAAAHRGALADGRTVAVLGCGIDRHYPAGHRALTATIAERGLLVSEFPLGYPPLQQNFPRRNRLISGLSLGTVVVEAAERSGSISTAFHALEQGREVFAVPGSVNNPLARGCHALLRLGARLTTGAADVFEEIPQLLTSNEVARPIEAAPSLAPAEQRLLALCGWDAVSIDLLVERSGLTVPDVSAMLLAFELAGLIRPQTAGTYVRIR